MKKSISDNFYVFHEGGIMLRTFLTISLFCTLIAFSCGNPSASKGNATVENNSSYTVDCLIKRGNTTLYSFSLSSGSSKGVDVGELADVLIVTFPDGTSFTGFFKSGDTAKITNSGVTIS